MRHGDRSVERRGAHGASRSPASPSPSCIRDAALCDAHHVYQRLRRGALRTRRVVKGRTRIRCAEQTADGTVMMHGPTSKW